MGNCIRRHEESSSMKWGGEDWGPLANGLLGDDHDHDHQDQHMQMKKKTEEGDVKQAAVGVGSVKIRMTKKQLEELLGRVELKQMTVHQIFAQLMSLSTTDQRSNWRPALQSIPEVN